MGGDDAFRGYLLDRREIIQGFTCTIDPFERPGKAGTQPGQPATEACGAEGYALGNVEVTCPILHQPPAPVEVVGPPVCQLSCAPFNVG